MNRESRPNSLPEWLDPAQSIPVATWQHIFLFRDRVERRSLSLNNDSHAITRIFPSDTDQLRGATMYLVASEKSTNENFTTVRKEVVVFGTHARFIHLLVSQEMSGTKGHIFAELASPLISQPQEMTRSGEQLVLSDGRNNVSIKLLQEFVGWHMFEKSDDRYKKDFNEIGNFKEKLLACLSLDLGHCLFTS